MVKAIRITETGGPEVLKLVDVDLADPGAGEVQVKHTAIGLNYIDTYFRTGLYPAPIPCGLGLEAAGVVTKVGDGVTALKEGDRVAYGSGPLGAYSEAQNAPANRLVKVPDGVSDKDAAAMMLKGMTAHYLLRRTYEVKAGDTILFHAAAGGVGLIACQWAKHLGATVIGTVGSEEKAALAKQAGADHTILYRDEDVPARVREITGGKMVPVVYDGVGKDTFNMSLDCLAPLGLLASFGNASGPVPPFDLSILNLKGSLFVTRPSLAAYTASDEDLAMTAADLFEVMAKGAVKADVRQEYALADAAQAHKDLEGRKTTGATVLIP
ncbi:Quinone oxidoreductase [Candidatus Phaeomarinobacter ectocarpi]|uniref:Quinone oxidoreductase n=1 Tax=Candidatus Phaeomarinibacter ectocarpi TaxID=1458461 RepID=X5MFF0_9HYPH|nr:quinone oxidoreductase [Candidatus Phaeomarinobacter ectocarpi]CDO59769.1 Quinone oxidoreductase [Candidatus Phaeomarinobacter ectocarpi]